MQRRFYFGLFLMVLPFSLSTFSLNERRCLREKCFCFVPSEVCKSMANPVAFVCCEPCITEPKCHDGVNPQLKEFCERTVNETHLCYLKEYRTSCCNNCMEVFTPSEGCEFGDHLKNCNKDMCNATCGSKSCCKTCSRLTQEQTGGSGKEHKKFNTTRTTFPVINTHPIESTSISSISESEKGALQNITSNLIIPTKSSVQNINNQLKTETSTQSRAVTRYFSAIPDSSLTAATPTQSGAFITAVSAASSSTTATIYPSDEAILPSLSIKSFEQSSTLSNMQRDNFKTSTEVVILRSPSFLEYVNYQQTRFHNILHSRASTVKSLTTSVVPKMSDYTRTVLPYSEVNLTLGISSTKTFQTQTTPYVSTYTTEASITPGGKITTHFGNPILTRVQPLTKSSDNCRDEYDCRLLTLSDCYKIRKRRFCCATCRFHRRPIKNLGRCTDEYDCSTIKRSDCYTINIQRSCCATCRFHRNLHENCPYGNMLHGCDKYDIRTIQVFCETGQPLCCETCLKQNTLPRWAAKISLL